jgi:hypothetical protein
MTVPSARLREQRRLITEFPPAWFATDVGRQVAAVVEPRTRTIPSRKDHP